MTSNTTTDTEPAVESHIGESGLWIPPHLREFTSQIIIRTPRATIQHFQSTDGNDTASLDAYYPSITADHFGDKDSFMNPANPELAPDCISIKPQGEDAVVLPVDVSPDVRCDGGTTNE